jgi:mRNA interferase RelE/StbE
MISAGNLAATAVTDTEFTGQVPWKVEVTSPALRGFRRLPEKAAAAIVEFVTGPLADSPQRLSKPLTNELFGLRTARRGDYRVLFTLDIEERILYVYRIEHRSDIYKPR